MKKLPVIFPDDERQRYACEKCARGCRELTVHLTGRDRSKIDGQDWAKKLGAAPYVRLGRGFVLNHTADEACVFLREDGLCRIHAEFGFEQKPLACQLYPFTLDPEADGFRVSVRFDCPSIARSTGEALHTYRPAVRRLAAELKEAAPQTLAPSDRPVRLTRRRELSLDEVDGLMIHLDGWLADTTRPIDQRLLGVNQWVDTLETARLDNVRDERFIELISLMVSDLPNTIKTSDGGVLRAPDRRQLKLISQAVFSHCESVTLHQAQLPLLKRLGYRLGQLKRARQLARGSGAIPHIVKDRWGGTLASLKQIGPDPALSAADCDELLTRYLRTRLLGRTAFGPGYHGWPVLDGLRALLLAVAVIGWLTRYWALTDGRETYTYDDVIGALGVVDRHAARSPELGSGPAQMRVGLLGRDRGLLQLLAAYPIVPAGKP